MPALNHHLHHLILPSIFNLYFCLQALVICLITFCITFVWDTLPSATLSSLFTHCLSFGKTSMFFYGTTKSTQNRVEFFQLPTLSVRKGYCVVVCRTFHYRITRSKPNLVQDLSFSQSKIVNSNSKKGNLVRQVKTICDQTFFSEKLMLWTERAHISCFDWVAIK